MDIIEKAVQRLDQLKRAGVTLPESVSTPSVRQQPAVSVDDVSPLPAQKLTSSGPEILVQKSNVGDNSKRSINKKQLPSSTNIKDPDVMSSGASRSVNIDLAKLDSLGIITPHNPRSAVAEEYRVIKRPLLRNVAAQGASQIKHGNLIMVTSSVPGEGKSFTAINLAVSIAMELERTVLLVDADVARPSILNRFGLPPAQGLMDVLLSKGVGLSDVLLRTNIEKLSILPAGMPHQRATELLASQAMADLLEGIATRYPDRVIIFDSPPLLVTTEARVLATHMGQIVVVVEAARTTQAMIKQALATIENCPIKLMLLNKTRDAGPNSYYGHYAPYGYGQRKEN